MDPIRYVALGDSYTIGTSVDEHERWPNQLVDRLRAQLPLDLVANLGINGYTSIDLIEDELPRLVRLLPQFVTVLIGVNDVVQRIPESVYSANVADILETLIAAVGAGHIVAVSIPDYTLTPQGAAFGDPEQQRAEIGRFNEVMAAHCARRGITFVSIDSVANLAGTDRSLVARDGLHPSGAQYGGWVDLIAPAVMATFDARADS
jgi:lysophospholipase L1-like esterase